MATSKNTTLLAAINWALSRSVSGLQDMKYPAKRAFSISYDFADFDEMFFAQYTMAAAGTQVVDFRSFANLIDPSGTVTATGIAALFIAVQSAVAGSDAVTITLEPGASDALAWPLTGTAPVLTIENGGVQQIARATAFAVDATHRNLLLTNTGADAGLVTVVAVMTTI